MDKQLAGKIAEPETLANAPAVDDDRAAAGAARLVPFGDDPAVAVKQCQPTGHRIGAVAGPVICRHDPRMEPAGVAEQREIGRKIERVEIAPGVAQAHCRQAHPVEAEDRRALRQKWLELSDRAVSVERGDKDATGAARR